MEPGGKQIVAVWTDSEPGEAGQVWEDALAEVEAGRSGVRHYGPHGETTPEDLADTELVLEEVRETVPLSVSRREDIERLRAELPGCLPGSLGRTQCGNRGLCRPSRPSGRSLRCWRSMCLLKASRW